MKNEGDYCNLPPLVYSQAIWFLLDDPGSLEFCISTLLHLFLVFLCYGVSLGLSLWYWASDITVSELSPFLLFPSPLNHIYFSFQLEFVFIRCLHGPTLQWRDWPKCLFSYLTQKEDVSQVITTVLAITLAIDY